MTEENDILQLLNTLVNELSKVDDSSNGGGGSSGSSTGSMDRNDYLVLVLRVISVVAKVLLERSEDQKALHLIMKCFLSQLHVDSHKVRRQVLQNLIELLKDDYQISNGEDLQIAFSICNTILSDWDAVSIYSCCYVLEC
jgi:hypothetical protein